MLSSLRHIALFASLAALGAGSMPAVMAQPALVGAASRAVKPVQRGASGVRPSAAVYGRKGAGVSMAQQQRSAAKKRNVARNRRHHR